MYKYLSKDNLFYLSNPNVILGLMLSWMFIALLFNHPLYIMAVFITTNLTIIVSGNVRPLISQLKIALPLIIIIVLINSLFNSNGSTILFTISLFRLHMIINLEALVYGLVAAVKLLTIITAFSFFTLVIDPDQVLNLTRKLGYKISLIINISMRLFSLIWQDYRRIQEIQKHRSSFNENNKSSLLDKLRDSVPSLSILLVNSLERSLQTAESLYSRGYGSGLATTYYTPSWRITDYLLIGNTLFLIIFALWVQLQGWTVYSYYPHLSDFNRMSYLTTIVMSTILSFPILLNWSYKLWLKLK